MKNTKIKNTPILIDTNETTETIIAKEPVVYDTITIERENDILEQDKIITGKNIIKKESTYEVLLGTKDINDSYSIICEDNEVDKIKKQEQDKLDMEKSKISKERNGKYDYQIEVQNVDVPNQDMIIESKKTEDEIRNGIDSSLKVTNITKELKPYFEAKEEYDILASKEEINKKIKSFDNIISSDIKPIRNEKKDKKEVTTVIVNTKKDVNSLKSKEIDNDKIKTTISYKEIYEDEKVNPILKNFKTKDECLNYLDKLLNEGYTPKSYTINPKFIKNKIVEFYDTLELANERKDNIKKDYPSSEVEINKKRELSKDIVNSVMLDEEFETKEQALNAVEKSENIIPNVIKSSRLKTITIDNEPHASEVEALERVKEISKTSLKDMPVHYALKKIDDYYYGLSIAYYAMVDYYEVEYTKIEEGYKYELIALIPKEDSFDINVEATKKQKKYKVEKEEITKGYSYAYNIKYNEKKYTNIYTISTTSKKSKLNIKTNGSYDKINTFTKVETTEKPIYKYQTRIKQKELELTKDKVKVLVKTA